MKRKILVGLILMFLVIGTAVATDVNNLKMPDGWESYAKGNYHEIGDSPGQGSGRNMMIMEYTNPNCDEFFENGTDDYYIYKNSDCSYNFTDWILNRDEGCFEVVEIDGKQYFVMFTSNIDKDYSGKMNIYDTMLEFNKLNDLKPIEV
jgi:hypothetical protein